MKKIVCGCVVVRLRRDDFEILLVSDDGNTWGLPKGGVEPGEGLESAAIRETLEETSIVVKTIGYVGFCDRLHAWYALPVDREAEPVPLEGEILGAGYFPMNALPEIEARQLPLISEALERLKIATNI